MVEHPHTNQFDYDKGIKTFVADASDLGFKPGFIPLEIALTSSRTGRTVGFTLERIEEDGSLKFETGHLDPLSGIKIHIIND